MFPSVIALVETKRTIGNRSRENSHCFSSWFSENSLIFFFFLLTKVLIIGVVHAPFATILRFFGAFILRGCPIISYQRPFLHLLIQDDFWSLCNTMRYSWLKSWWIFFPFYVHEFFCLYPCLYSHLYAIGGLKALNP